MLASNVLNFIEKKNHIHFIIIPKPNFKDECKESYIVSQEVYPHRYGPWDRGG